MPPHARVRESLEWVTFPGRRFFRQRSAITVAVKDLQSEVKGKELEACVMSLALCGGDEELGLWHGGHGSGGHRTAETQSRIGRNSRSYDGIGERASSDARNNAVPDGKTATAVPSRRNRDGGQTEFYIALLE